MSEKPEILIVEEDRAARTVLKAYLADKPRYSKSCEVCDVAQSLGDQPEEAFRIVLRGRVDEQDMTKAIVLDKPVRLGAVLDVIERILKSQGQRGSSSVVFGPWVLDTVYHTLERTDQRRQEGVRLTEKEVSLLKVLHEHTGQSVAREALLETVWAYAEGVETHTLETHIYRLRQKIEENPSAPKILITTDSGYLLVGQ